MEYNKSYLVIVAGGAGKRMGSAVPKQFIPLAGKPLIFYSVEQFLKFDRNIEVIIVLSSSHIKTWEELCMKYSFNHPCLIAEGGTERFHSVKNGLDYVKERSLVAVHDAVRPLVSVKTIADCFRKAEQKGNAIPVITPPESVRMVDEKGNRPLRRGSVVLVQTPQVFDSELLKQAYTQEYSDLFTDDASVIESMGETINHVEGNKENIKITTPTDIRIAESLIGTVEKAEG